MTKKETFKLAPMDSKVGGPQPMNEEELAKSMKARQNLEAWREFQKRCPEHKWVT